MPSIHMNRNKNTKKTAFNICVSFIMNIHHYYYDEVINILLFCYTHG